MAEELIAALDNPRGAFHLQGAAECRKILLNRGFDAPRWGAVAHGFATLMMLNPQKRQTGGNAQLPPPRNASGAAWCGPGCRQETELCCGLKVVKIFLECHVFPLEILVAGNSGSPFASPLVPPYLSRLPVWPSFDSSGHHAACSRAGVLGSRGYALESAAARVCREAGGRVSTNIFLRKRALDTVQADVRKLEVVVTASLSSEVQFAIDTTLVSPLRGDRNRTDVLTWMAQPSTRPGDRTNPELCVRHSRARLVVLAAEVGGRWYEDASSSNSLRLRRPRV